MGLVMKATSGLIGPRLAKARAAMMNGDTYVDSLDPHREAAPVPSRLRRVGTVTTLDDGRQHCFDPHDRVLDREILYLPGGGYVNPLIAPHWDIVERLGVASRSRVTMAPYPVAPEHSSADTIAAIEHVYDQVRSRADRVVVAGDSAGGHAALTLAGRHAGSPTAADGVIAIAPWIDLFLTNPEVERLQPLDLMLGAPGVRAGALSWLRDADPDSPTVNVSAMSLETLPPLLLAQGGHDIFHADTLAFAERAAATGVSVELVTSPDGFHVYPAAWWTSEAKAFFASAGAFVERIHD